MTNKGKPFINMLKHRYFKYYRSSQFYLPGELYLALSKLRYILI